MRAARLQGPPQPRPRHASLNEALERAAVSGRRGLTFVAADETEQQQHGQAQQAQSSPHCAQSAIRGARAAHGIIRRRFLWSHSLDQSHPR